MGIAQALWQEATRAQLVDLIDRHCPKRRQGLTTGQYLAIAAINRAISPRSKRSMWVWFSQTVLRRHMPSASEAALASQRFWDHMDSVTPEAAAAMWTAIPALRFFLGKDACFDLAFRKSLAQNTSLDLPS